MSEPTSIVVNGEFRTTVTIDGVHYTLCESTDDVVTFHSVAGKGHLLHTHYCFHVPRSLLDAYAARWRPAPDQATKDEP